jgi:hypothetical protein
MSRTLEAYMDHSAKKRAKKAVAAKKGKGLPSSHVKVAKAKEILRHGEVHGKPLTKKQRGMFGAAAGKGR